VPRLAEAEFKGATSDRGPAAKWPFQPCCQGVWQR